MDPFAKGMLIFTALFVALTLLFYWIVADDWRMTAVETTTVAMGSLTPEGSEVSQQLRSTMDAVEQVTITPHLSGTETGSITVLLLEGETVLWQREVPCASLRSDEANAFAVEPELENTKGRELTLTVRTAGTSVALWIGDSVAAGKFDVNVETAGLAVDGAPAEGQLVATAIGHDVLGSLNWFWPVAAAVYAALLAVILRTHSDRRKGRSNMLTMLVEVCRRYSYLLKQLVWRDFRVKYKASVMGVLWSFLNPLLTMLVYYFVFSTLFRSNIEYFPVYLMAGIVVFNYFSESTTLGLSSIVDNSALITKVYMPKYIYPMSRVLSSALNLCISFVPLLLVMLVVGVPMHKSLLLLPLVVAFLVMFCLGMSLMLSSMNVFFGDTKFLWGVLTTMWNFLTPIFYPESIIPAQFTTIFHMNPLYQIVFFMRSIIIGGVSPTPVTYLYCLAVSVIPLVLGLYVFRKNQDRFVLYL